MKTLIRATLILSVMGLLFLTNSGESSNSSSLESWGSKYEKAGTIKIYEPRMGTYGAVVSDKALMHINLVDIAKFSGHLCGCSTSGFMMTKLALESLYGKGEIPVRGDIRLTSNLKDEPMEIAAYIIGASDREHHGYETWIIDKSIETKKGSLVLIFERISTGKKIKLAWDKIRTLKEHTGDFKRFKQIKLATLHGLASDAEAKEFRALVNSLVMKIINGELKYEIEVLNGGEKKSTEKKGCLCHDVMN